MNIFVLHLIAKICARYHVDKHVVKMVLETAQLLSTAHHLLGTDTERLTKLYKPTHANHPCSIWVRETTENYIWLYNLFTALCDEYTFRFDKIHKTDKVLREYLKTVPEGIKEGQMTPFALAMPEQYKTSDPIESYKNYYLNEKSKLFKWTNREIPSWVIREKVIIDLKSIKKKLAPSIKHVDVGSVYIMTLGSQSITETFDEKSTTAVFSSEKYFDQGDIIILSNSSCIYGFVKVLTDERYDSLHILTTKPVIFLDKPLRAKFCEFVEISERITRKVHVDNEFLYDILNKKIKKKTAYFF